MPNFFERQYKKLPKKVRRAVSTTGQAVKIKASEELEKIAKPAAEIIAEKTREAGKQSIGPWIATATIVLALVFITRGRK